MINDSLIIWQRSASSLSAAYISGVASRKLSEEVTMTSELLGSQVYQPHASLRRNPTCSISAKRRQSTRQHRHFLLNEARNLRLHAPGVERQWRIGAETTAGRPLRLIQHKDEAFWFYRFLSIVYDKIGESWQYQNRHQFLPCLHFEPCNKACA